MVFKVIFLLIGAQCLFAQQVERLAAEIEDFYLRSENYEQPNLEDFDERNCQNIEDDQSYDFIVIGAGTSGSVIANTLARNFKTLVLEEGEPAERVMDIPGVDATNTKYLWRYSVVKPRTFCKGVKEGKCEVVQGHGVGGLSLVNNMDWNRGDLLNDLLTKGKQKTFCQIENRYADVNVCGNIRGPWPISITEPFDVNTDAIIAAANTIGLDSAQYNFTTAREGIKVASTIMKNAERQSAAKVYLERENLKLLQVRSSAKVLRININPETKRAESVTYVFRAGTPQQLVVTTFVDKEVILAAGPVSTPQILQLSGVGPEGELVQLGIKPVIRNEAIGQMASFQMRYPLFLWNDYRYGGEPPLRDQVAQYLSSGTGPLARAPLSMAAIQKVLDDSQHPLGNPRVEYDFSRLVSNHSRIFKDSVVNSLFRNKEGKDGMQIDVVLLNPVLTPRNMKGRVVTLKSRNPFQSPTVRLPEIFEQSINKHMILNGARNIFKMIRSDVWRRYVGYQLTNDRLAPCRDFGKDTDAYWLCSIEHTAVPNWHLSGTVPIGSAVQESNYKLIGAKNIRISGTSIIPLDSSFTAGNNMAPNAALGLEVAKTILKSYYYRY